MIIFTLLVTVWKETPGDDMLITIHQVRSKLVGPRYDVRSLGMRFWVGIVGIRYFIDLVHPPQTSQRAYLSTED